MEYVGNNLSSIESEREIARRLGWKDWMSRYVSIMSRDRLAREGGKKKNREKVRFGFVLCDVDLNKI